MVWPDVRSPARRARRRHCGGRRRARRPLRLSGGLHRGDHGGVDAVGGRDAELALEPGPGRVSLDHPTGDVLNGTWMKAVALGAVVPASVVIISRPKQVLAAATAREAESASAGSPQSLRRPGGPSP